MFECVNLLADHKDLIHDVAYDFHGKRIATCSSDQSVKVWDLNEKGQWVCSASWKTHHGSVWKVDWAHPEFGQVLATCSFDRTTAIWEEVVGDSSGPSGRPQKHWLKKCTLVDSRSNVTAVQFAPRHLGLLLATCSANGVLRVYEAPDIMNLNQWNIQHEITVVKQHRCSCLSWNASRFDAPLIAVGCDEPNAVGAKVWIFEYSDASRKWSLAETLTSLAEPVHDVAFAPDLGRSFHTLAVASKLVHVFRLKSRAAPMETEGGATTTTEFETKQVAAQDGHEAQVWRVSWNVTGTMLASTGADGSVKLWKANYLDNWKCVGSLKSDAKGIVPESISSSDSRYY